jgi:hypothetical protein
MVNQRHPDAIIVSGDIGETPEAWKHAREPEQGESAGVLRSR